MKIHTIVEQKAILGLDRFGFPNFVADHLVLGLLNGNAYGGYDNDALAEAREDDETAKLYKVRMTIEYEELP